MFNQFTDLPPHRPGLILTCSGPPAETQHHASQNPATFRAWEPQAPRSSLSRPDAPNLSRHPCEPPAIELLPSMAQQNPSPKTGYGHPFTNPQAFFQDFPAVLTLPALCALAPELPQTCPESSQPAGLFSCCLLCQLLTLSWFPGSHGALSPSSLGSPSTPGVQVTPTSLPPPSVPLMCIGAVSTGLSRGCWHRDHRLQLSEASFSAQSDLFPLPAVLMALLLPLYADGPAGTPWTLC